MKRCATILLALLVTFSVAAPPRLDAALVSDDAVAQAIRCQSVLLCYSFFSVLPLKIISQMNTVLPAPRSHDGASAAASDTSGTDATPAPFDISTPGSATISKTLACKTILPGLDVISAGANHVTVGVVNLPSYSFAKNRALARHHWMFMLPRGSIDDHILKTIDAVNEPIAACPRLAFSLGGNV